jgi:hypothetical protein
VHGDNAKGPVPLTLEEALEKKTVKVVETGSVNELKIENTGSEDVFIQSGDIVKGGRQDRVLTASFVLPPASGEIPVASFCVEHGRWSGRGAESAKEFASAANVIPSREAKLAMRAPLQDSQAEPASPNGYVQERYVSETGERQQQVWDQVTKTQEKLSAGVSTSVASPLSSTSLELSLENQELAQKREAYIQALEIKGEQDDSITGFVFAVNGHLNSAEIYPSNGLFRKMWKKMLTASVTEAIGAQSGETSAAVPSLDAVAEFLALARSAPAKEQTIEGISRQLTHDAPAALLVEAARPDGSWIHRSYLAK